MRTLTETIRRRCWHSLSPETANAAAIDLGKLQQFCIGAVDLDDDQIAALARYFGIKVEEDVA